MGMTKRLLEQHFDALPHCEEDATCESCGKGETTLLARCTDGFGNTTKVCDDCLSAAGMLCPQCDSGLTVFGNTVPATGFMWRDNDLLDVCDRCFNRSAA